MSSLSFTKLFSSITDSSVWQESAEVRVVWVTMMAMADPLGRVHAAVPGLARRANVSRESTEKALEVFLSPDPDSRSKDHDGRRIEEIDGGWRLLNYAAYREKRDDEARKEQNRLSQQKRRKAVIKDVSINDDSQHLSAQMMTVSNVSNSQPASAQEEEEEEEEVERQKHVISPDMIARAVLTECGLSGRDLAVVLDEICRSQVKLFPTPGALRDALVAGWREYDTAKPDLTYTKGAAKFFGDGDWRNPKGWPWKDGKQPASANKRRYVNE